MRPSLLFQSIAIVLITAALVAAPLPVLAGFLAEDGGLPHTQTGQVRLSVLSGEPAARRLAAGSLPDLQQPAGWQDVVSMDFNGGFPTAAEGWSVYHNQTVIGMDFDWGLVSPRAEPLAPITSPMAWPEAGGIDAADPHYYSYSPGMDNWLVYGPFSLAGADQALLSFRLWLNAAAGSIGGEDQSHYFYWMASADGINFSGYRATGTSSGWDTPVLDLASVPGLGTLLDAPQVWIAFNFEAGLELNSPRPPSGPFVDDVRIQRLDEGSQPDLAPYVPAGWDAPVVTARRAGGHFSEDPLSGQPAYVDWAAVNYGTAIPTAQTFQSCLYLDGSPTALQCWQTSGGLNYLDYAFSEDFPLSGLAAGSHTLRLVVDSQDDILESDEANNELVASFELFEPAVIDCTNGYGAAEIAAAALPGAPDAARLRALQPFEIGLQARRISPQAVSSPAFAGQPLDLGRHALLQFYTLPDPAGQAALEKLGVRLLSYIPDRAWIVSLAPGTNLSTLPGLRWAGELRPADKLSPLLANPGVQSLLAGQGELAVMAQFAADVPLDNARALVAAAGGQVAAQVESIHALTVILPANRLAALAGLDAVTWVEPPLPALDPLNDCVRWRMGVDSLQAAPFGLSGAGVSLLIYDVGAISSEHHGFDGRLTLGDEALVSEHSTHVAGIAAGDGAQSPGGRSLQGIAPAAELFSYAFEAGLEPPDGWLYTDPYDLEADWTEAIHAGVEIGNASIGTNISQNGLPCDWMGDYGLVSELIDQLVVGLALSPESSLPPVVSVWAGGNERGDGRCGFSYFTTAPPAGAKNSITVGSSDSDTDAVSRFSSFGPTDDGRIKPTLVAPGCESDLSGDGGITSTVPGYSYQGMNWCGTSMAAPAVSGVAALLLEDYRVQVEDPSALMLPALTKALLIHSAADLGLPGPDYQTGYGRVDAAAAVALLRSQNYYVGTLTGQGAVPDLPGPIQVEGGSRTALKVTLVWDDVPANPAASLTLVNDLELTVTGPGGEVFHPYVLNPLFPDAPARRGADHVNNQEQVIPLRGGPGGWTIQVSGASLPSAGQSFALVWSVVELPVTYTTFIPTLSR